MKKLKSKKGESFVEILISILIVALGCMMIATMYSAAMNMNIKASEEDDEYYNAMSDMEKMFENSINTSASEWQKRKVKAIIKEDVGGNSLEESVYTYGDEDTIAYRRD